MEFVLLSFYLWFRSRRLSRKCDSSLFIVYLVAEKSLRIVISVNGTGATTSLLRAAYIYLCFENRLRPERRGVMCVDLFLFSCLSFLSVRMCVPERVLNSGRSGPDTPLVMIAIALLAAPCTRGRVERGFGRNLLRETFFTREQHPRIPVVVVTDSRRKERRRVWTRCEICR